MLAIFSKRAREPAPPAPSQPPPSSNFSAQEEISVSRYSERLPGWIFFPSAVLVEIALLALAKLLDSPRYDMQVVSADMLAAEMVSLVVEKHPALICMGAVAPGGLAHARYLCKRIRARCPDAKIVVGRWGFSGNIETARTSLTATGADRIATTLNESRDQVAQLVQLERAEASPRPLAAQ